MQEHGQRSRWLMAGGLAVLATCFMVLNGLTAISDVFSTRAEAQAPYAMPQALAEIRPALWARPDLAGPWRDQAQWQSEINPEQARASAVTALRCDPRSWEAWLLLGQLDYQLNRSADAAHDFAMAARFENGFDAHYQLANFAIVLNDRPGFWRQLRAALQLAPAASTRFAIDQAIHFAAGSTDPNLRAILPADRPFVLEQAVYGFLAQGYNDDAAEVAQHMHCDAATREACRNVTIYLVNAIYEDAWRNPTQDTSHLVSLAQAVWRRAGTQGMVPLQASANAVSDGEFHQPWTGDAYSWRMTGPVVLEHNLPGPSPTASSVAIEFDGQQPENTELFRQFVAVRAGGRYHASYSSRSPSGSEQTGVHLAILVPGGAALADIEASLRSEWRTNQAVFQVPDGISLIAVSFMYTRPLGQVRLNTPAFISDVQVRSLRSGSGIN